MSGNKFSQLATGPIFIVGAARSGTTWIYDIFHAHPEVAGVFESWLFTPRDGIGSLFTKVHWPPQPSGLGRLLSREDMVAHARKFLESIMSHAIKDTDRFLMEKSPSHLFSLALILEIFPDARIIHVVRDGRDVAVSVRAATESWIPSWKNTFGKSLAHSADAWHDAVRRVRRQKEELGTDRILEIRYEDLHRDAFEGYRRMFDFCGIPHDQAVLEMIFRKTDFNLNFISGQEKFRRGGRVGDWKRAFSRKDAAVFHAVAGSMLIELGYEDSPKWVSTSPKKR